jgi:hypothetical protein
MKVGRRQPTVRSMYSKALRTAHHMLDRKGAVRVGEIADHARLNEPDIKTTANKRTMAAFVEDRVRVKERSARGAT